MLLTLGGLPSYKDGCPEKSFTRMALALFRATPFR
jgi:hypothetical protein